MSNLSLARIMYGRNEELRRGAAYSVPAKAASFVLLPATQSPVSFSKMLRRIWLRFSAKS